MNGVRSLHVAIRVQLRVPCGAPRRDRGGGLFCICVESIYLTRLDLW